jgi:sulfhydrogenase subunit beta (sulfur reductase)
MTEREPSVMPREDFDGLFGALKSLGYEVVGPRVRDGAIVYDRIGAAADLPVGWRDELAPGKYRILKTEEPTLFNYNVGPSSWKNLLFPPRRKLWTGQRVGSGDMRIEPEVAAPPRLALLGVRACELAGIRVHDRVFQGSDFVDADYAARRDNICVIAVNCVRAGGTCFCVSMNSGPGARSGFDLSITEIYTPDRHDFVLTVGSDVGAAIIAALRQAQGAAAAPAATLEDLGTAAGLVAEAAGQMGRKLETAGIKELLYRSVESPHWADVAERCLSCANCTLVCPTCFCSSVEDVTDLTGEHTERWQRWDSCFTMDHSYLHGGSVRATTKSRYRQWLTHKLGSWIDQFGESGCVGCGKCIAWCPVGIDLTAEMATLRLADQAMRVPVVPVVTVGGKEAKHDDHDA